MPSDSFFERARQNFVHRHRINLRFRQLVAGGVWISAAIAVLLAAVIRDVTSGDGIAEPLTAAVALAAVATVTALRRPAPAPHAHGLPGMPDGPCPDDDPDLGPWASPWPEGSRCMRSACVVAPGRSPVR